MLSCFLNWFLFTLECLNKFELPRRCKKSSSLDPAVLDLPWLPLDPPPTPSLMVHLPLFYLLSTTTKAPSYTCSNQYHDYCCVRRILVATDLSVEDEQIKMIIVRNDTNVVGWHIQWSNWRTYLNLLYIGIVTTANSHLSLYHHRPPPSIHSSADAWYNRQRQRWFILPMVHLRCRRYVVRFILPRCVRRM